MSSNSFFIIFFTNIKASKDLPSKYYQSNKERLQKKLVKDIKVFLNDLEKSFHEE